MREFLAAQQARHVTGQPNYIGPLLSLVRVDERLAAIAAARPSRDTRILDVGTGGGRILDRLAAAGFTNLLGIDPYVEDHFTPGGVRIKRAELSDLDGRFDLIMFHHSLEHLASPVGALRDAAALLAPNGICLVRIPTVSSEAWERYGVNWVQIDAPRHITIPSREGMRLAAEAVGLRLDMTFDDSSFLQFTGSERYARGLRLHDSAALPFARAQIRAYRREARRLNAAGRGDQAAFYLRKPG